MKLPKKLTSNHCLIKVELEVVKVRAIGVKADKCVIGIDRFYEIAEETDFKPPFNRG
jgi:hypothetical protein